MVFWQISTGLALLLHSGFHSKIIFSVKGFSAHFIFRLRASVPTLLSFFTKFAFFRLSNNSINFLVNFVYCLSSLLESKPNTGKNISRFYPLLHILSLGTKEVLQYLLNKQVKIWALMEDVPESVKHIIWATLLVLFTLFFIVLWMHTCLFRRLGKQP